MRLARSLRSRMTAAFAIAFAVLILLFDGFLFWFSRNSARQHAEMMLQTAADKIEFEYADSQRDSDPSGLREAIAELAMQDLAIVIMDKQERVVHKTPGSIPTWPPENTQMWRARRVPLGNATAIIGYPWEKIELTLRAQSWTLIALSVLLFFSAMFGVWLLVGRTLSPIYDLSVQADAASAENMHIRLEAPSPDAEMVHLVGTLNALLERLSSAISSRERFYAAASHELRTPLQTLNGYLEFALMRPRSAEEYRTVVAEAYSQSERLSSLVQALLLLNQLEAAPVHKKEAVNLGDVCEQWLRSFEPLVTARRLRIEDRLPEDITIHAIRSHADILLHNLLENAIKYATPGSEVRLSINGSMDKTELTLFNHCPTLAEWNGERLFEPFYRPDASRNSDTGGNGLGLAICKAVAVANGWTLSVKQEVDGVRADVAFH